MSVSALCTKRLWAVARRSSSSGDNISVMVIREIVNDPELHAEAKRIAPQVGESVRRDISGGANPDNADYRAWYEALQPLLVYAPPKDLPSDQRLKHAWFSIGYKATDKLPISVLKDAVAYYIETSERSLFPAWGKLNALGLEIGSDTLTAAYRIRAAARQEPVRPAREKTPEEREAVRKMLAEFKLQKPPTPAYPGESQHAMADRLRAAAGGGAEAF